MSTMTEVTNGKSRTVADFLQQLGDVPPERVRIVPPIGLATLDDLIAVNESKFDPICEWVDGSLIEKARGNYESWLTCIISGRFMEYLTEHRIGILLSSTGALRIRPDLARSGTLMFVAWESFPGGRLPPREDRVPEAVPDLVLEVLFPSNTPGEMARKRKEYFTAGVKQVWEIEPIAELARAYSGVDTVRDIPAGGILAADDILPGFALSLAQVFARANRTGGAG